MAHAAATVQPRLKNTRILGSRRGRRRSRGRDRPGGPNARWACRRRLRSPHSATPVSTRPWPEGPKSGQVLPVPHQQGSRLCAAFQPTPPRAPLRRRPSGWHIMIHPGFHAHTAQTSVLSAGGIAASAHQLELVTRPDLRSHWHIWIDAAGKSTRHDDAVNGAANLVTHWQACSGRPFKLLAALAGSSSPNAGYHGIRECRRVANF